MKNCKLTVRTRGVLGLATTLLLALPITAQSLVETGEHTAHTPLIRAFEGGSLNWSGYAVSTPNVTSVSGTFIVPEVAGPGAVGGLPPDMSAWVGIDGYTSGTVEQIGVSGTVDSSGKATYYAWWEMYPRNSQTIKGMKIAAGDKITASVNYLGGGRFKLSITDITAGQSFSTTQSAPVGGRDAAQLNSAEWVIERAATIYKGYLTILPLTTFAPLTFTDATFVADGTSASLQDAVSSDTHYAGYPDPAPLQPYWEDMYIWGASHEPLDEVGPVVGDSFTATFIDNGTPVELPGVFRR